MDAGPFESKPTRAYYYLTDVDPSWPPERQDEHLRDYNYPTLWSISIHEVYPGHFLHYQHLRRVESKARKSILFAPASFVEGWAHYCEQMMIEAGFGRQDHGVKLGQLAEALIRLVRFIVGIKLHTEDMSVEQGVRLFREEAFMEEASARREAERGTFDPTYLVYSVGKLMLLKLRQDYKQQQGKAFSLRTFHDTLLGNGTAPFWLHRQLMLGDDDAATCSNRNVRVMPLYEYQCDACGHRFEVIQKFSDPPVESCPKCGGTVHKLMLVARDSVQGQRLVHHRLREEGSGGPAKTETTSAKGEKADKAEKSEKSEQGDKGESQQSPTRAEKAENERATIRRARRHDQRQSAGGHVAVRKRLRPSALSRRAPADRAIRGTPRTCPRDRAAAARSRPPPSGIRACCRCRGGRPSPRRRRSAASSAARAGRWSAESRRCDRSWSPPAPGKISGVRM